MRTDRTRPTHSPSTPPEVGGSTERLKPLALAAGLALAAFMFGCGGDNPNASVSNANTAATPRHSPTPQSEIEREIGRLSRGVAGVEFPTSMDVGQERDVVVEFSPEAGREEEVRRNLEQEVNRQANESPNSNIAARSRIEVEEIRYSDVMKVELVAQNEGLQIKPVTEERQAISRSEKTVWRWNVKAVSAGAHRLHLKVTAFLNVNGKEETRSREVLGKTITVNAVQVPWSTRIGAFFEKNVQWIFTAILIPLFLWLVKRQMDKKKKRDDEANSKEQEKDAKEPEK